MFTLLIRRRIWNFSKTILLQFENPWNSIEIESDYHSAIYKSKNLNTWVNTNSTEVNLNYFYDRLGQMRISKIFWWRWIFWKQWLDSSQKGGRKCLSKLTFLVQKFWDHFCIDFNFSFNFELSHNFWTKKTWAYWEFWHVIDISRFKFLESQWFEFWFISKFYVYAVTCHDIFYNLFVLSQDPSRSMFDERFWERECEI